MLSFRLSFFPLYCTAGQHPAQNANTQRYGQPAPKVVKVLFAGTVLENKLYDITCNDDKFEQILNFVSQKLMKREAFWGQKYSKNVIDWAQK